MMAEPASSESKKEEKGQQKDQAPAKDVKAEKPEVPETPVEGAEEKKEAPEEKKKPVEEEILIPLAGNNAILVQCSVCGVVHSLKSICYSCGSPLCDSCKKLQSDYDLGYEVVICRNCQQNQSKEKKDIPVQPLATPPGGRVSGAGEKKS
jgi:hypothetical protein